MKSKLHLLFMSLALLARVQQAGAQLTNSVYGFYFTAFPGADCYATNVNGFANIAYLQWDTPAVADQIIACNSKLLVDLTWVFWNGNPGLNPNFQTVWNGVKAQFTPYYLSQIAAFYVIDEPYTAHGLTPAELQTAVACIKADFPNIPVAVTFDAPSVDNFNSSSWIPANLDWISFDVYNDFGAVAGLLSKLETYKQPNQKIFLTPQGFRNGDSDATVAAWSYDYHDLYLSDPEIMGQLVFLSPGAREYVFPSDGLMPLTYAVQQTIGTEVLKMGNSFKRAFSDMFESASLWTANWPSVGAWARAISPVRAGSYSAKITGSVTDSALTSKPIGVLDARKASVNFWWYIHGLASGEYVRCDIKLDNGAWIQKATLDGGGSSGDQWLHVIASDIDVSGATNLYVRFRGKMNSISKYASVDSVNVCKWADPTVTTWPTAASITNGQTLNASILSGGSATPGGSFAWAVPLTVPPVGISTQSVIYTPTDTSNYNRIRGSVSVTAKANSTVTTWPTATAITYGQTLTASTLSGGSATPAGTFSWAVPSTVPSVGTSLQSVHYTPTDTNSYNLVSGYVNVRVSSSAPNLIANGDFAANAAAFTYDVGILGQGGINPTSITSWTVGAGASGLNGPATGIAGTPFGTWDNAGNNYNYAFLNWGAVDGSTCLLQNLSGAYTPNTQYELTFDVGGNKWTPSSYRIRIGDNTQTHFTTGDLASDANNFHHFRYIFTSPAVFNGPSVIKLMNITPGGGGVCFANVALQALTLSIAQSGANLQLNWSSGTLLEANAITGPWTTNGATPPYLVVPAGDKKFYRVQVP